MMGQKCDPQPANHLLTQGDSLPSPQPQQVPCLRPLSSLSPPFRWGRSAYAEGRESSTYHYPPRERRGLKLTPN